MENQRTDENGFLIPENTFTEEELLEIADMAARYKMPPEQLLAEAWRSYVSAINRLRLTP